MNEFFRKFAQKASVALGSSWAFLIALLLVVLWAFSGPFFHYSDTWELVINTTTTIITFLMVFLIQNTQNRDAKAIHLKLDELIQSVKNARNDMIDLEDLPDEQLDKLKDQFRELRNKQANRESKADKKDKAKV